METNDYESDSRFGHWLRDQRVRAGLNLRQAAMNSGIAEERLKALEIGYAERGITLSESEKISAAYKVTLVEFLSKAAGNV